MAIGTGGNDVEVNIGGDSSGLQSALAAGISQLNTFEVAIGAAGAALAAIAAKGLSDSIRAAGDLDAALTQSTAIMGDVSDAMRNDMSDAARQVARETTFAAEEAGDAFYYLASAGMDAEQSIEAMPQVARFAQAGMFDLATATDLATDAQSALGLASEDAEENLQNLERVTDVLVKSNTLANASVEEFSQALTNKAASAMRQVGMEVEEGAAALAVFADQGLKGQEAGTILARTIEGLTSQARDNAGAFKELGVEVFDAEGEMRPMHEIIGQLENSLGDMSTEQRDAALAQLGFNERTARGVSLLMGNTDALKDYEGELQNAAGTTEEIAEKQLASFWNQLDLLRSQIRDIAIGIGNVFLPVLTSLVSVLVTIISAFADFNSRLDGMPGAIGLVSVGLGGLLAASLQFSGILSGALVPALSAALSAIVALGAPILAVGAIVGAAAYAWQTDFAGIRESVQLLSSTITSHFSMIAGNIRDTVMPIIGDLREMWSSVTSGVEARVAEHVQYIQTVLLGAITALSMAVSARLMAIRIAWNEHRDTVEAAIQTVASIINSLLGVIAEVGAIVAAHLGPAAAFVRDVFASVVASAIDSVISIGQTLFDLIIDIGTRFGLLNQDTETAADALGQLLDPFKKVTLAVDTVNEAFGVLTSSWDEDWMGIRATTEEGTARVNELFGGMESDSGESLTGIQTTIQETLFASFTRIQEEVDVLREAWDEDFGALQTTATETFGHLWQIVSEILIPVFTTIVSTVSSNMNEAENLVNIHLGDILGEFAATLNHILENVINPFLETVLALWDKYGDEILTFVELVFDIISTVIFTALDAIATAVRVVMAAVRGDWDEVWTLIASFLERTLDRILSFITGWGSRLLSWLAGLVSDFVGYFKDLARDLIGASVIPDMLSDIMSAFEGFGSDALSWLSGMVSDFVSDVKSFGEDVVGKIDDMAQNALGKLDIASDFKQAGKDLISGFADGITAKVDSAKRAAKSAVDAVKSFFPSSPADEGPLSELDKFGPGLVFEFADGITDNVRALKQAAMEAASAAQPPLEGQSIPLGVTGGFPASYREGDTYNIDISVKSTDPDRAGNSVMKRLERELESGL